MRIGARRRTQLRVDSVEALESRALLSATTAGTGLLGQYFDTPDLTGATVTRQDGDIDFDWGSGSPDASIGSDTFSARWTGQVEAQFTETYSFIVNADDGARLWVNGQLLVNQFEASGLANETETIDLIAGRRYDIQLEYREGTGNASVMLEWSSPSQPQQVVPTERLHPASRGSISVDQFTGISGNSVSDLTSAASFPNSPNTGGTLSSFEASSNAGNNFGQRIRGLVHAPETGRYHFSIAADESAELWLSNSADPTNRQLIAQVDSAVAPREFDASPQQTSAAITLVAGESYYIEALHKESSGDDHLAVGWQLPSSTTTEVIAGEYLSPARSSVRIFSSKPNVSEGAPSGARFTIVREGGSNVNPLVVSYSTRGDAINGTDYASLPGTITIPAGESSVTLSVTPLVDSNLEGDESVIVELTAGSDYDVGLQSQRTVHGQIQDNVDAPAGGSSLWTGTALGDFDHFGGTFTTENDATFGSVIQAAITSPPASLFSSQLRQTIDAPVTEGDILFAEFRVRSIGGPGEISAIFERAGAPFTKSLSQGIPVGTEWERVQIPFYAAETYAVGEASFGFHLGHQIQTLQFAEFNLLNYGPPRSLAPETNLRLNNINGTWGTAQTVPIDNQTFDVAYEVDTHTVPAQVWHIQAVENNEAGVSNGDTMRVEFFARSIAGADPKAGLTLQRTDTFASLFNQQIDLNSTWQFFSYDITSTDNFDPGGLQFVFNVGHGIQTIQIGGLTWENLNNNANIDDLPKQFPAATYGGRDADDLWRDDASSRIEDERRSLVTVNVVDADNNPLNGAVVNIRQDEHAFKFGSAINAFDDKLDPDGTEQALKYQSEINRLFNAAVLENSHKWPGILQDRQRALDAADFAVDNDLYLRGHNAIWPSREHMPESVWNEYDSRLANDGESSANAWLTATIEARIADVANTFQGQALEWDVVNEPFTNHDVMDILGDDIVVDWYQQIRDIDPDALLALNDFGIFASNGNNTAHRDNFDYWLGKLNDAGLLDIIGEQSHYNDANLTDITVFADLLESYNTEFNTQIAITEFDVNTKDEQLQADYLRDYLTMAFSQPSVEEFLHWGFWESAHWLPDAALYRADFSVKPNGQAYEDLVFGEWWSDTRGTTLDGAVSADVFRGDYNVIVQYDGVSYPAVVTVDDSGTSSVTVQVPVSNQSLSVTVDRGSFGEADGDNAATLTVTRSGPTTNALVVNLSSSDDSEAILPATVTLPANVDSVDVPIDAIDDTAVDGTVAVTLTASAAGFDSQSVSVDVTDNESGGFQIIESDGYTLIKESGKTDTVDVVLLAAPTSNVVIDVSSADTAEATVNVAQLVFTPSNWDTAQTVVVSAVDDAVRDGRLLTDITFAINEAGSDDGFDDLDDQIATAISVDNDSPVFLDFTTLIVNGTDDNDDISIVESGDQLTVDLNGEIFEFSTSDYQRINIDAFKGDDTIVAETVTVRMRARLFGGNDLFRGGLANDTVSGGGGRDTVFGNDGNDLLSTASGVDIVEGGNGNDRLRAGNGADTILGQAGEDTISGGGGLDSLLGGTGDDSINGGSKVDYLEGGPGNDLLFGGTGGDRLVGGEGNDLIDGEQQDDSIEGGAGRDVLLGGISRDTISGGDGEDIIVTGSSTLTRAELISIVAEWSSGRTHAERLSNVRGDSGQTSDRLNTAFLVGADRDDPQTVFDDSNNDTANGNDLDDVFFAAVADKLEDRLDTEWWELL